MNILSVNKYYWRKGGSEAVFFNEMDMLQKHGHTVVPFSMKSDKNFETPYSTYFADEVDYTAPGVRAKLSNAAKIIYSFDAKKKIRCLLSDFKPDIAHFHIFQHQLSPSVFGPLRDSDVPIVLTLHDLKPLCPVYTMYSNGVICEKCKGGKFINCTLNRCTKNSLLGSFVNTVEMYFHELMGYYRSVDKYISVSNFYRSKMIEYGYDQNRIVHIPNYIELDDYKYKPSDNGYVLYFGRLSKEKGLQTLLDAAKTLTGIPFYIAGAGPIEEHLHSRIINENIDNVTLLGFKTGDELNKLISEASIVVVPSEWYENCPMSVLESFASSKPVIGSNIGGIPELIEDGVDGFIFEPGDSINLAEIITSAWNIRSTLPDMGSQGRHKIAQQYNAERHYDLLSSVYASVLKG